MVMSDDEIKKLYRIRKTLLEMLRDRGYLVADVEMNKIEDEFKKDPGDFGESQRDDIKEALVMSKCKNDNPSDQIYVFFPKAEKIAEKELLINITKHTIVPEHRVLTDAEKRDLLERYKVKEAQLPKILVTDPVVRYYGLRRGQVVKIIRPSETAGRSVIYRSVV
ncbi:hypothetical protein PIB30_006968 [Stylosanthes scabra]|uniref:Uncharacterized protein n=1 Tax=Stylosanthes scabra TaxID=79078 RepID=A0ABU6Y125_9FABA|nr:hypothetical protein [Stylosanthes scabra]